jgi:hypothetical protein
MLPHANAVPIAAGRAVRRRGKDAEKRHECRGGAGQGHL